MWSCVELCISLPGAYIDGYRICELIFLIGIAISSHSCKGKLLKSLCYRLESSREFGCAVDHSFGLESNRARDSRFRNVKVIPPSTQDLDVWKHMSFQSNLIVQREETTLSFEDFCIDPFETSSCSLANLPFLSGIQASFGFTETTSTYSLARTKRDNSSCQKLILKLPRPRQQNESVRHLRLTT